MRIQYHRRFTKQFKKLDARLKRSVRKTIGKFIEDQFDPGLHNHALKGKFYGLRAIAVTGDIRIIFEEFDGYTVVVFLDIGGYSRIYS